MENFQSPPLCNLLAGTVDSSLHIPVSCLNCVKLQQLMGHSCRGPQLQKPVNAQASSHAAAACRHMLQALTSQHVVCRPDYEACAALAELTLDSSDCGAAHCVLGAPQPATGGEFIALAGEDASPFQQKKAPLHLCFPELGVGPSLPS